jgi:hypothetical protein
LQPGRAIARTNRWTQTDFTTDSFSLDECPV